MAKNSFYFPHDDNAGNDEKILELRAEFGGDGYMVYFMLLENMARSSDGYINKGNMAGLSLGFGVTKDRVLAIVDLCISLELFLENGDRFFSERMMDFKEFRRGNSENGKKGAQIRWAKKQESGSPAIASLQGGDSDPNSNKRKGKEIKGNIIDKKENIKEKRENIKEKSSAALPSEPVPIPTPVVSKKQLDNEIELDFNIFYSAFPVKKGKEQAIKNFKKHYKKVKEVGLQFILDDIKWRISNDKQWLRDFIPHPGTYISESRWSDEPNAKTGISQPTSSNPKTTTTTEVLKATIDHYNDSTLSPEEFVKRRLNG